MPALFGSLLRVFRSRVARLYSPHGGSLHYDEATVTGKLFFALERLMARFTDYICCSSRTMNGAPSNARSANRRSPTAWSTTACARPSSSRCRPTPDAADFLYIGMMRDLKGPDLFIDALAQVETRARPAASAP